MKKIFILSLLLFSFNGWTDEQGETATLKNFSIYIKHLIDVSDDLHICAELYTAYYGYGSQNPESKISQVAKPEEYLKEAGRYTLMATGLQELLRLPLNLTSLEERNFRTSYYMKTIALADEGNKQSMIALREDLQYCVDIVKNHDELLTEIHDQYKK